MVGWSIASISELGEHIYLGALRLGKYDALIIYIGYGPPYCTIYITYSTVGRSIADTYIRPKATYLLRRKAPR